MIISKNKSYITNVESDKVTLFECIDGWWYGKACGTAHKWNTEGKHNEHDYYDLVEVKKGTYEEPIIAELNDKAKALECLFNAVLYVDQMVGIEFSAKGNCVDYGHMMRNIEYGDEFVVRAIGKDRLVGSIEFEIIKRYHKPAPPKPWYTKLKFWRMK